MSELIRIPYGIDGHVHFRDPRQTHKEDIYTGSSSAAAGGILQVVDMPNNAKHVLTKKDVEEKIRIARSQTLVDIGFHVGTKGAADQHFSDVYNRVKGVKVYMNETTGGYEVTTLPELMNAFKRWNSPMPVLVHAEGVMLSVALNLAQTFEKTLYVCHVSKKEEVELIRLAKDRKQKVFAEVTPHHLFLDESQAVGNSLCCVKPHLNNAQDREVLWSALRSGIIDVVATDHAPHTLAEKESATPPFGVTGLETMFPLLLRAEREGRLTMNQVMNLTHYNPQRIFSLAQEPESYVEIDRDAPWVVKGENLHTKARWSPFEGERFQDRVVRSVLRGRVVFENGKILAQPGTGKIL